MGRVVAVAVASVAIMVGCAGASAAVTSGIQGTVIRSPTKPVCEEGAACTAPAAGVVLVFTGNDSIVARATTARDGSFHVPLVPGVYIVRTRKAFRIGGFRPVTVTVRRGHFTAVKLTIDTGIR
jgi:hypothetical protein